jgi:hypothetical protein
VSHTALDGLIRQHVDAEGLVDYRGLMSKREILESYIHAMARVDPVSLTEPRQLLAYWINVYNANMLHLILENIRRGRAVRNVMQDVKGIVDPSKGPFDDALFDHGTLGSLSLNDIENRIIREDFFRRHYVEPRIHVALVCGARSCPPLIPRAYEAADLDDALEAGMRRWLRDSSRNVVDPSQPALRLSAILASWYSRDFDTPASTEGDLLGYLGSHFEDSAVRAYLARRPPIQEMPYDWSLNVQPGRSP